MDIKLAVVKGDGIGPEIVTEAEKVLDKIGEKYGHTFEYTDILAGGCAIDETGVPLPEESVKIAKASDSVLLGAVGGPKWDTPSRSPETGKGSAGSQIRAWSVCQYQTRKAP